MQIIMSKKTCLRWMQGGAEDVKLNELISNGLMSRLEKADVAWLAFKDEFPGVNQDQFRRALLRCRKGCATAGKMFFGVFNNMQRYFFCPCRD